MIGRRFDNLIDLYAHELGLPFAVKAEFDHWQTKCLNKTRSIPLDIVPFLKIHILLKVSLIENQINNS